MSSFQFRHKTRLQSLSGLSIFNEFPLSWGVDKMTARIPKEGGVGAWPGDSTSKGCLHNQKKATAVHQKFTAW